MGFSRFVTKGIAVAASCTWVFGWQGPPPSQVRVDGARFESVQQRSGVTGEVRPVQRSFVATREPGLVLELDVRAGSRVESGALLARLDGSRLELDLLTLAAQRSAAVVAVEQRREESAQAHRDVETTRELAEKNTVGRKLLVDMTSAARVADILMAQAESELNVLDARRSQIQQQLQDMELRAPFGGVVVDKLAEVGQWLAVGDALVEIVSDGELEVWLDIPQRYAGALHGDAGSKSAIEVRVDALDRTLELKGGRVVPQVDARARTFKYVLGIPAASVADGSGAVTSGMSVSADVPTGERGEQWTVARDGILRGETGSFLYVARPGAADAPHVASLVPVRELFGSGGRVVVQTTQLEDGDLVVIEGNERLFPGAPVLPDQVQPGGAGK